MKKAAQLSKDDARDLFDYRDGMLYWKTAASGRAPDLRAVVYDGADRGRINIGGIRYEARYVVWNWHHGIADGVVRANGGGKRDISIENLRVVEKNIGPVSSPKHCCPMCSQALAVPTFDTIARRYELQPLQAKILRAIWDGKGHPVVAGKIFDAMYEDDIDGGPSSDAMYSAFKVALCRLRAKIEGSGVSIENVGYRGGYRLVMEGNKK